MFYIKHVCLLKSLLSKCMCGGFSLWSDWVGSLKNELWVHRCVLTHVCTTKSSFPVNRHSCACGFEHRRPAIAHCYPCFWFPRGNLAMSVLNSKLAPGPASEKTCQITRADNRIESAHQDACRDLREAMAHSLVWRRPLGSSPWRR